MKSLIAIFHILVESTHYNVTSVAMQVIASDPGSYTGDEKWLAILPLYHMYGAMFFLFLAREYSELFKGL